MTRKNVSMGIRARQWGLIMAALICSAVVRADTNQAAAPLRIGIYSDKEQEDSGHSQMVTELNKAGPSRAELFRSLKTNDLFKYDVVILSDVAGLSKSDRGMADANIKDTDYVKNLLLFIDHGRGLVLGYNCVGAEGFWSQPRLFPEFIAGDVRVCGDGAGLITIVDRGHPIAKDLPATLSWTGKKILAFRPGKAARIIGQDAQSNVFIAASEYSRGRVVAIGGSPDGAEAAHYGNLLRNAALWAGGGQRQATAEAIGLLAAVSNAVVSDNEQELAKYLALPKPNFDEKIMFAYIYRFKEPEQLRTLVRNVKKMGFDGIIVNSVVKNLSYPSKYYDNAAMIVPFDQLAIVVDECKKQGLKYGFCFGPFSPMRGGKEPADLPRNIPKEDYLAGKQLRPEYWACPDHPGVQQRGLDVVKEQIEKYHPDYMYLDFIRYIEGYTSSCYCEYSRARKKEFAAEHPGIKSKDIDAVFAEQVLTTYTRKFYDLCKRLDPKIKTIVYTITPDENDAKWLFKFPIDWHTKYVSRSMIGAWRPIDTVEKYTIMYDKLNRAMNPVAGSEFMPMLAGKHGFPGEKTKSPVRLEAELKALSATMGRLQMRHRVFLFYEYKHLLDENTLELQEPYAAMFREVFIRPEAQAVAKNRR